MSERSDKKGNTSSQLTENETDKSHRLTLPHALLADDSPTPHQRQSITSNADSAAMRARTLGQDDVRARDPVQDDVRITDAAVIKGRAVKN